MIQEGTIPVTPADFNKITLELQEVVRTHMQKEFLVMVQPLFDQIKMQSFGWQQEYHYNDEGYPWTTPWTISEHGVSGHEYLYMNGQWFEDEEGDDGLSNRRAIYDYLSSIEDDVWRFVFGVSKVTVYKDRIELQELGGTSPNPWY